MCQSANAMWSRWSAMLVWILLLLCCSANVVNTIIYQVTEEQPPNTLIGSLAADQGLPDTGHLYKLEVGAPYLRVDGKTGDIYTTETPIDRETLKDCRNLFEGDPCFLEFEVSITDLMKGTGPRLIEGRIEILDENDNTPQFSSPVLTLSIPENTHVGVLFAIPVATDKDSGSNGIADYALTTGPEAANLFSLQVAQDSDEKLPQLIVLGNLDREQRDSYDLNIKVVDGGSPPRQSSALLRITITDANDNVPRFEKTHYEGELPENSPVGHSVLQVKANDSDMGPNGEVTYSLHQAPPAVQRLLSIDRNTGTIFVKGLVDREEISMLKFYVQAKDNGPQSKSSKSLVTITVKDQNDNAPLIRIRGIGLVTHEDGVANISEDMPVGTAVALVEVSDRDEGENAVVTCVVAGDVPFQLRSASETGNDRKRKYFLQTTTLLDYERIKDYRIEIVAVDSGNPALSSTNSLRVQVTDMNDNSPVFSPSMYQVDFPEENQPGDKVLDVLATDADSGTNAELTYSITGGSVPEGLFEINPNTGEVRVMSQLDREQLDHYQFLVAAADKGVPSLRGTATVVVKVLDRNDNDPKFMLNGYSFSVQENMPPLSPVGMVTVTDYDEGDNAHVQIFVEPDNGKFMIQNGTYTILSTISFDREKESTYSFRLKAVDGGDPPRSSYVGITINVLDENDNAPYVTKPSNSSYKFLDPRTSPETHVERVEAEDIDIGSNSELDFSIVGGNPHGLFRISSEGEITLAKEFTSKHIGLHRLVVKVKDRGTPVRHTTALVHIYVNETIGNVSHVEGLVGHSLYTPLEMDIAGDPDYSHDQHSNILFGVLGGLFVVILIIVVAVIIRRVLKENKSGYQAGKKETKDLYAPKPGPKSNKNKKAKKSKVPKPANPSEEDEGGSLQKGLKFNLMDDSVNDSPRIHLPLNYPPGSPDLGRHYRSNSPLPSIQLQPQSPSASKKHQAVQDLPATNTFVGTGDNNSTGSDQYSDYSYKANSSKYSTKQLPHRRVTFSTANQAQDLQDPSQHSYYDSGLEESETPSSKSSSGPRIGPLALPEDHYERTTPDGSIGEMEHPENDLRPLPDVAMTGKCTRECTEYGHSDSCWMPGQPSPNRTKSAKSGPKLSTFVPYQEREGQERLMADSSSKPHGEERSGGGSNKVASIRFLPPYTSAYSTGGDSGKDCPREEIPLSQTADYVPATTPSSQGSKREIYL
ncbi:protocadherin-1 isoform X2 [Ctenopharyngodon idella]|nr:protocadherin-1 isoform X2 [Ctenopharyngodon idella]XP_051774481.1 protocadherin-1 isoform X2 [Ctenopharyngodon idella]